MIFFTADTHFGHANILKLCSRPFDTIEKMNETMKRNNLKYFGIYDIILTENSEIAKGMNKYATKTRI